MLGYQFGFEFNALSPEAYDGATYENLDYPLSIDIVTLGTSMYALVASFDDDGVQIIDITELDSISPVLSISDGTGNFTTLNGAYDLVIAEIDSSTYALVTAINDNGVQIIDITDINNPIAASVKACMGPVMFMNWTPSSLVDATTAIIVSSKVVIAIASAPSSSS